MVALGGAGLVLAGALAGQPGAASAAPRGAGDGWLGTWTAADAHGATLTCADCTNGGGGSGGRSAHVPDHHLSGLG